MRQPLAPDPRTPAPRNLRRPAPRHRPHARAHPRRPRRPRAPAPSPRDSPTEISSRPQLGLMPLDVRPSSRRRSPWMVDATIALLGAAEPDVHARKAPDHDRSGAFALVPPAGFEPATPALGVRSEPGPAVSPRGQSSLLGRTRVPASGAVDVTCGCQPRGTASCGSCASSPLASFSLHWGTVRGSRSLIDRAPRHSCHHLLLAPTPVFVGAPHFATLLSTSVSSCSTRSSRYRDLAAAGREGARCLSRVHAGA